MSNADIIGLVEVFIGVIIIGIGFYQINVLKFQIKTQNSLVKNIESYANIIDPKKIEDYVGIMEKTFKAESELTKKELENFKSRITGSENAIKERYTRLIFYTSAILVRTFPRDSRIPLIKDVTEIPELEMDLLEMVSQLQSEYKTENIDKSLVTKLRDKAFQSVSKTTSN